MDNKEKNNKKFIYLMFNIIFLCATIYLSIELCILNVLPIKYLAIIITFITILYLVLLILLLKAKNRTTKIINSIICLLLSITYCFGGFYLQKTSDTLSNIASSKENIVSVSVVTLADSNIEQISDLKNKDIGIMSNLDTLGTTYITDDINEKGTYFNEFKYDSIHELCNALYDGEISAIILNESYRDTILEQEDYTNFDEETKVIYTFSYDSNTEVEINKVDNITSESFNILITGTDSRYGVNAKSRSDVNMIATVNPQTGIILLTSIPRDYYVEEVCDLSEGCPNGQLDKLTHTGNHGMYCVKKTIEKFMDIEINYTLKVSFESVTKIVDALGGIEVYVPAEAATNCLQQSTKKPVAEGYQTFDAATALGFARERYSYKDGDSQRIRNQQIVIKGIIDKVTSPSIITSYTSILDAISGTFITDLSEDEIKELAQFQIASGKEWKFETYSLTGEGGYAMSAEMGRDLYMCFPNEDSIVTGKNKIEAVLDGKPSVNVE